MASTTTASTTTDDATHPAAKSIIIIFLDMDGVLLPFSGRHRSTCGALFPDANLYALSRVWQGISNIIPTHDNCTVAAVLSSTWRVSLSACDEIVNSFRSFSYATGMDLPTEWWDITDPDVHSERQHEIYAWLQQQQQENTNNNNNNNNIAAWVALDDEELLQGKMNEAYRSVFEGHVVKTDSHVGLTCEDADQAVQLVREQLAARSAQTPTGRN